MRPYSAYIPCFNNAATIRAAVESVVRQEPAPSAVYVIDDASTDQSRDLLGGLPAIVLRQERNLGRGATRARGIVQCTTDFVLCSDATTVLAPDFVARALPWFEDPNVAVVFGRIQQSPGGNAVRRWRGKHLFKLSPTGSPSESPMRGASLATSGAIVRRAAILAVGNFDPELRHSEDADLGARLIAAGWDVVHDPALPITTIADNTLGEVLERYWRWYAGKDEAVTWRGYLRNIRYSVSVATSEITSGDPAMAAITLLCPHFCFWRSVRSRLTRV